MVVGSGAAKVGKMPRSLLENGGGAQMAFLRWLLNRPEDCRRNNICISLGIVFKRQRDFHRYFPALPNRNTYANEQANPTAERLTLFVFFIPSEKQHGATQNCGPARRLGQIAAQTCQPQWKS